MSAEIPTSNPEKKEVLDDNARKFIVETIDPEFLSEHGASSFTLVVDWLEMNEDNETKVVYKRFDNDDIQILLITKVTKDDSRTSEKQKITEEEYKKLATSSKLHLEKKRYEFIYPQNNTSFSIKYDEFVGGGLRMLEVDASSAEGRDSFNPSDFSNRLDEVTGNLQYYGYRIADIVSCPSSS